MVVGGAGLRPRRRVRYEVIPHTADTGIVVGGATLSEVFVNSAYGMFDLMFDIGEVSPSVERQVEAVGDTVDELLVGWLSVLLAVAEIDGLAFSSFAIQRLEGGMVAGVASGVPSAGLPLRGHPIKGVTFHDLAVEEVDGGLQARVIFDV
jgi:SHS2 domain-containing protein